MAVVVTTSPNPTATAYSNQRKVDRTSNGVLWSAAYVQDSTTWLKFYYSTDNGVTWTASSPIDVGGTGTSPVDISIFIDVDDYCHAVYKNRNSSILYRRGTPNAARTAWTWSAPVTVMDGTQDANSDYPDVVAHREGTGWVAHLVTSYANSGSGYYYCYYNMVTITSAGGITLGARTNLPGNLTGHASHKWPSIDFNHTGDGKTVAGGTPHVYVAWSAGKAAGGFGIRFRKATYSAGSWTWGTEREIDSTRYTNGASYWLNCLFDGTRVVIGGYLIDGSTGYLDLILYDRDVADTTTTARVLLNDTPAADYLVTGSMSYDSKGDIHLFGVDRSGANGTRKLNYRKWTRSSASLSAIVTLDSTAPDNAYISTKRGHGGTRIEILYTDGTANPYNVTYESISLNTAPTAPTLGSPAAGATVDAGSGVGFSWTHNDPDSDPQNAYSLRRKINGTTTWYYWTGSAWSTSQSWVATSTQSVTIAASHWTDGQVYDWSVATRDPGLLTGPYAAERSFTIQDAVPTASATGPADKLATNLTSGVTFSWTFNDPNDTQNAYSVRRRAWGSGTYEYWTGTAWSTTQSWVSSSSTSVAISTWPSAFEAYLWSVAVKDSSGDPSTYTAERSLNPWEQWNGTAWVYTETPGWVASTTDSAQVPVASFVSGSSYEWTVATKDSSGDAGPSATAVVFTVGGAVAAEGWGQVFI